MALIWLHPSAACQPSSNLVFDSISLPLHFVATFFALHIIHWVMQASTPNRRTLFCHKPV